ncbi:MAG: chemotaxis protein CheD [Clostridiales bacterium]|nr:MAG: chemotaxis protein CheD [Clostridiales bacterium]
MMDQLIVGISDYRIASAPAVLTTYGLGSCMGVALYDEVTKTGGLIHILLPDSRQFEDSNNDFRFADTGLPRMVTNLESQGAVKRRLWAKIAGGASMFGTRECGRGLDIGGQNIKAVCDILKKMNIPVKKKDVGGHGSRTLHFNLETGLLTVRKIEKEKVAVKEF